MLCFGFIISSHVIFVRHYANSFSYWCSTQHKSSAIEKKIATFEIFPLLFQCRAWHKASIAERSSENLDLVELLFIFNWQRDETQDVVQIYASPIKLTVLPLFTVQAQGVVWTKAVITKTFVEWSTFKILLIISNFHDVSDKIIGLHDTCGVNNLHGMPGVLAGICGVIVAAFASDEQYGDVSRVFADFKGAGTQVARQAGALGVTLVMALLGGVVTGLIVRILPSSPLKKSQMYNDTDFWEEVVLGEEDGMIQAAGMTYAAEEET